MWAPLGPLFWGVHYLSYRIVPFSHVFGRGEELSGATVTVQMFEAFLVWCLDGCEEEEEHF